MQPANETRIGLGRTLDEHAIVGEVRDLRNVARAGDSDGLGLVGFFKQNIAH